MYKILTETHSVIGYVDFPAYIKVKNGFIVPSAPAEASGLNVMGEIYNLPGHSDFEQAPTAFACKMTDGEFNLVKKNTEKQTTDLQLALADVYEAGITQADSANNQITQLQLALVELYETTIQGG